MSDILKIQVDILTQDDPDKLQLTLIETITAILSQVGIEEADIQNHMQVTVKEQPKLTVDPVTAGIVVAGFVFAGKLVELYMYLKQKEEREAEAEREAALQAIQQATEEQKQQWKQEFIERVLVNMLLTQANLQPTNIVVEVVQQDEGSE